MGWGLAHANRNYSYAFPLLGSVSDVYEKLM